MRTRSTIVFWAAVFLAVFPPPSNAQWRNLGGPGGCSVQALAVNGRYLFAGTPFGIFVSTDEGGTWTPAGEIGKVTSGSAATQAIYTFGANVFASTRSGLFLSRDNGAAWTAANSGLPEDAAANCLVEAGGVLFCGLDDKGIYRSTDSGANWMAARTDLPDEKYVGISSLACLGQALYAGYEYRYGVYRSGDSGASWAPMVPALPGDQGVDFLVTVGRRLLAATGHGLFAIEDGGKAWSKLGEAWSADEQITFLASSGQATVAGLEDGRAYLSTDAGTSWTGIAIGPAGDEPEFSGFAAVGPRLFVAVTDKGLFRSDDLGATWSTVETGFPSAADIPCLVRMEGALFAAVRRWGVPGSLAVKAEGGSGWERLGFVLPEEKDFICLEAAGTNLIAGTEFGFFLSDDRGRTWSPVGPESGDPPWVNCLETVGSRVFAGTTEGIFLSTDRGRTWVKKFPAPPESASFECFAQDGSALFAGGYRGIFVSRDRGETWRSAMGDLPEGTHCVSLATDGKVLLAGVFPRPNKGSPAVDPEEVIVDLYPEFAILRTGDGGKIWSPVTAGLPPKFRVGRLAVSGSAFVASLEDVYIKAGLRSIGLFLSTNGGVTWTSDWPGSWSAKAINDLLIEKDEILAATAGAGIWRLPLSALKREP